VSIRTVYRDIDALSQQAFRCVAKQGVGYRLEAGYHLPPLNLTAEEAEALALGARVLATWSDGAVAGKAAAALAKIRAVLPASGQAGVDQDIFWAPQWVERHAPKVDLLELKRAAQRRRVLVIEYEALNGARTTRTVRPLSINYSASLAVSGLVRAGERFPVFPARSYRVHGANRRIFRDEDGKRLADFKRVKGEEARLQKLRRVSEPDACDIGGRSAFRAKTLSYSPLVQHILVDERFVPSFPPPPLRTTPARVRGFSPHSVPPGAGEGAA
jgi:hypothetical protein